MHGNDFGAGGIADQRYYHFVVLRDGGAFSLATYWKRLGDVVAPAHPADYASGTALVQHRKLRSSKVFARGVVAETLSERGQGRPPFLYDVFGARVQVRDAAYFILGFPFVGLATDAIAEMLATRKVVASNDFVSVDVPKLVGIMEAGVKGRFEGLHAHIVNLHFVVTDDKALTAVRLGGDDPLSADVYVNFLRERVTTGFVRPELCVLACEKEWPEDGGGTSRGPKAFRSRLRVDSYGNYRFYAHVGCSNLRLLPYALGQLRLLGCLRKASANPLSRVSRDDE